MTKEDLLWVAIKIAGVYYAASGLMALINFAALGLPRGGMGPPASMWLLSGGLPLAIGVYLLLDGSTIMNLASRRRGASGQSES